MGLELDIQYLQRVQLFQGFPDDQLRLLAFGARHKRLRAGEILFAQNDLSRGGHIILEGQLDLIILKNGVEVPVGTYIENSIVGETALISSNRCATTAISRTDSEILFIPRDVFQRVLEEYPELAAMLHKRISASMQKLISQLETVEYKLNSIKD